MPVRNVSAAEVMVMSFLVGGLCTQADVYVLKPGMPRISRVSKSRQAMRDYETFTQAQAYKHYGSKILAEDIPNIINKAAQLKGLPCAKKCDNEVIKPLQVFLKTLLKEAKDDTLRTSLKELTQRLDTEWPTDG